MKAPCMLAVLAAWSIGGTGQAKPPYHLLRRVLLGGEGRWDYVTMDPVRRRVFISHGSEVLVVDADRATLLGKIPDTQGVHGVALAQSLGRGFSSNGADSSVTIFDLASLKTIGRITVTGANPDAIVYDSVSGRVFTFNKRSGNATAIDAASGRIAGTVSLGGSPEFAVADGQGRIFVNLEDRSAILSLDTRGLTTGPIWPLAPCESPTGLALDRSGRRLFSSCSNRLMAVVDANDGRLLGTVPIGGRVDGAAFDPGTRRALSSNGEGTLTVVDASGRAPRVMATVRTEPGARTMALDPRTHEVFLVTAKYGVLPPVSQNPQGRPPTLPGTFSLLIFGP